MLMTPAGRNAERELPVSGRAAGPALAFQIQIHLHASSFFHHDTTADTRSTYRQAVRAVGRYIGWRLRSGKTVRECGDAPSGMFTPLSKGSERAQDNQWGQLRSINHAGCQKLTSDRTFTPRKARSRAGIAHTPIATRTPANVPGLTTPQPVSARQARLARRASLVQEDEGDAKWTKLFFRVRSWDHPSGLQSSRISRGGRRWMGG